MFQLLIESGVKAGAHLGGIEEEVMELMLGPRSENPEAYQARPHRRPKREGSAPTINQNEIAEFHAKVQPMETNRDSTDFYFRVFGTTVHASTFTLDEFLSLSPERATYESFEKVMKGEVIDYTESFALVGDELIVPTVSGLSLWVHNEGAAILSLKCSHSYSEDDITFKPRISPGISIANNFKMSIAGDIIEAGFRAETKLGASTDVAVTATLTATDDEYGLDLSVALPSKNIKLIEASNELLWALQTSHEDYDLKQKMTTVNLPAYEIDSKCAKVLPLLTGVQACVQLKLPQFSGRKIPNFPLSGPGMASLKLFPPRDAKELVFNFRVTRPG